MDFIVLTGDSMVNEKHMQADNLAILLSNINKTKRREMEYQVFSNKPFNFDTLLYTHHSKNYFAD